MFFGMRNARTDTAYAEKLVQKWGKSKCQLIVITRGPRFGGEVNYVLETLGPRCL